jgi:hypothetical protein
LNARRGAKVRAIRIGGEPCGARREEIRRHKVSCLPEEPLKNACVAHSQTESSLPAIIPRSMRLKACPALRKSASLVTTEASMTKLLTGPENPRVRGARRSGEAS